MPVVHPDPRGRFYQGEEQEQERREKSVKPGEWRHYEFKMICNATVNYLEVKNIAQELAGDREVIVKNWIRLQDV